METTNDIDECRAARHGRHLFEKAKKMGWEETSMEGPLEFIMRACYETGWNDRRDAENGTR